MTFSGVSGGTLMDPPLFWGCKGCGGPAGGGTKPSNLGNGPPAMELIVNLLKTQLLLMVCLRFKASSFET